jgi:hypothetical protein
MSKKPLIKDNCFNAFAPIPFIFDSTKSLYIKSEHVIETPLINIIILRTKKEYNSTIS